MSFIGWSLHEVIVMQPTSKRENYTPFSENLVFALHGR